MRKRFFYWELAGFLFTVGLGALLHFTYEWSGGNRIVAAFSAVNESTWEHMKLLFFPMLIAALIEVWVLGRRYPNFIAVRTVSILAGTALIPVLFYTYRGIWGQGATWVDISIFFVAAAGAFLLDGWLLRRGAMGAGWKQIVALLVVLGVAAVFVLWTFQPPMIDLFRDPTTLAYGMG